MYIGEIGITRHNMILIIVSIKNDGLGKLATCIGLKSNGVIDPGWMRRKDTFKVERKRYSDWYSRYKT